MDGEHLDGPHKTMLYRERTNVGERVVQYNENLSGKEAFVAEPRTSRQSSMLGLVLDQPGGKEASSVDWEGNGAR